LAVCQLPGKAELCYSPPSRLRAEQGLQCAPREKGGEAPVGYAQEQPPLRVFCPALQAGLDRHRRFAEGQRETRARAHIPPSTLGTHDMPTLVDAKKYRNDIDGLRAIAVVAVIIFHFGFLPNGYLGVDVFFVISGFLITGIIYNELQADRFTMRRFYLRRIRRIIPLSLFICAVALIIGAMTMLPDDFENLANSVVATSFFGNNVLQAITTQDYWAITNEYKPLMHTWSLGIEEQFYFFYPILLLLLFKVKRTWVLPVLIFLTLASLALFFMPFREHEKFYHLPFRFYELSLGGIAAILLKNKLVSHNFGLLFLLLLIGIICFGHLLLPAQVALLAVVFLTMAVLATHNEQSKLSAFILQNRVSVLLGLLSFSLYMWHQLILAYVRYMFLHELHLVHLLVISLLIFVLSLMTYHFVEQPFRDWKKIKTRDVLAVLAVVFVVANSAALYVHFRAGIVRDVPELGISQGNVERGVHSAYNSRVHDFNKDFDDAPGVKVLVLGNSFARDWSNVLLESKYKDEINISYMDNILHPRNRESLNRRLNAADIVFYASGVGSLDRFDFDTSKVVVVGTKRFGMSNGIFYNYRGKDYFGQRASMLPHYLELNERMKQDYGERFIDLIHRVMDDEQTVPVFTPTKKFISQDCRHFTKAGAQYFADLFEAEIGEFLGRAKLGEFRTQSMMEASL